MFKARDKNCSKKFVAMKKVLMDNEKEGVCTRSNIRSSNAFLSVFSPLYLFIQMYHISKDIRIMIYFTFVSFCKGFY